MKCIRFDVCKATAVIRLTMLDHLLNEVHTF